MNFVIRMTRHCIDNIHINNINKNDFSNICTGWFGEFQDNFNDLKFKLLSDTFAIRLNWKPLIDDFFYLLKYNVTLGDFISDNKKKFEQGQTLDDLIKSDYRDFKKNISQKKYVDIMGEINCESQNNAPKYVVSTIFHIWRCSNIAFPGILNLWNAEVLIENEDVIKLNLNSFSLGEIMAQRLYDNDSLIKVLSIIKTWKWYNEIIDTSKIITTSNLDRAITGLFNAEKSEGVNQTDLVWIFLGVESLYSLNGAGILQKLKDRAMMLLNISEENKKKFKKSIDNFYNYRSRFVHGDKNFLTYINDIFFLDDDILAEEYFKYKEVESFGSYLLVISLQKLVIDNRTKLDFIEVIKED